MAILEPYPFLPQWQVKLGPIIRRGKGTLDSDLKPFADGIDELRVFCGGFELSIHPKTGQIFADSQQVASAQSPCRLLWFRRMQQDINTKDRNTSAATCLWYGLGLECNGQKYGYRIRHDGVAEWGDLS